MTETATPLVDPNVMQELKHSIEMHTMIMAGPTPELAVFLLKAIDFMEDEDADRRNKEITHLAFILIEGLGIHVQKHIDKKQEESKTKNIEFPDSLAQKNGEILVMIGKTRHMEDKVEAKNMVLTSIADALRELSVFTKSNYPTITNSHRKQL
jgi:hypothetical protein